MTLAHDEVASVRKALARYQQARAKLDAEAEAGLVALLTRRQARRGR